MAEYVSDCHGAKIYYEGKVQKDGIFWAGMIRIPHCSKCKQPCMSKTKKKDKMTNDIILWEYQKKSVCEYYGCSDSDDKQYPFCKGIRPKECSLNTIINLIDYLNTGRR